jgi:hypothetical protein
VRIELTALDKVQVHVLSRFDSLVDLIDGDSDDLVFHLIINSYKQHGRQHIEEDLGSEKSREIQGAQVVQYSFRTRALKKKSNPLP